MTFKEWFKLNFNHGLFKGRYEFKDDPDGNKGSWTKKELKEKYRSLIKK